MHRTLFALMAGFALLGAGSSNAAGQTCSPTTTSHLQCDFDIPEVSSGKTLVVSNENSGGFSGAVAVACQGGTLTIGKKTCAPKEPDQCAISPSQWYGSDGSSCSHGAQMSPLDSGETKVVESDTGKGDVTYRCAGGVSQAVNMSCGAPKAKPLPKDLGLPLLSSQSTGTTEKTLSVGLLMWTDSKATGSGSNQAAAMAVCSDVIGYDISVPPTIAFMRTLPNSIYTGKPHQFSVVCQVSQSLRCDQNIVQVSMSGSFSTRTHEYSNPPTLAMLNNACSNRGYARVDKSLYMERTWPNIVDDFTGVLVCSGNQSSCRSRPNLGDPEIQTATSCTEATAVSGLIEVTRGSRVTNSLVANRVCGPLEFDSVKSIDRVSKEDETGGFEYYVVTASCGGYHGSEPLMEECRETSTETGGYSTPVDCDSGLVNKVIGGSLDPRTGRYDDEPNDGKIQAEVCNAFSYSRLDSVESIENFDSSTNFLVTANCSGYTGSDRSDCEVLGPCFGPELPSTTGEPYLVHNGKYYLNLCENKTDPPANICEDCTATPFTFTDSNTGNSCTVTAPVAHSGEENTFEFATSSINGEVTALCNNGGTTGISGSCYKSCPGGVTIGWEDKNGSNSCAQTVPSGIYKHEEEISFGSSLANTGNATFRCNGVTGNWEAISGQCLLDCTGNGNWGSGFSNSGVNKTNLCQASVGRVPHGASGSFASSTSNTTGTGSYSCNDGDLSVSGSCNVDCASRTGVWGGACMGTVPSMDHGQSRTVTHQNNPSHPYRNTISGSSSWSCDDGSLSGSGSCTYATRVRYANWSGWGETGRSCSSSPNSDSIDAGVSFTQTTTCNVDFRRTRGVYYVWNTGRETLLRTELDTKREIETSQQSAVGTKRILESEGWEYGRWVTINTRIEDLGSSGVGGHGSGQIIRFQRIHVEQERTNEYVENYTSSPTRVVTETDTETRTYTYDIEYCTVRDGYSLIKCP